MRFPAAIACAPSKNGDAAWMTWGANPSSSLVTSGLGSPTGNWR